MSKLLLELFSQALILITLSKNCLTPLVVMSHQKKFKPKSAQIF